MDRFWRAGFGRLTFGWLLSLTVIGCSTATVTPSASTPAFTGSLRASTTPSVTEPASIPTESPSPQPTDGLPSALATLPITTVPSDQLRSGAGDPATIARGSMAYTIGGATSGKVTVNVTDLATDQVASRSVAIPAAEVVSTDYWGQNPVATDGRYLVVLASHPYTGQGSGAIPSCIPHGNDWQLLTAPVDPATGLPSGGFKVFASGTMKRDFHAPRAGQGGDCWDDNTVFAVDGGAVAYTVDDVTRSRPMGSRILLRSLADGSVLRDVQSTDFVFALRLSGATIAWAESQSLSAQGIPQIRVRASTSGHPSPIDLQSGDAFSPSGQDQHLPNLSVSGEEIAWDSPGTDGVFYQKLGAGPPLQVSPQGVVCGVLGTTLGHVAMRCGPGEGNLHTPTAPTLVVATPGEGLRRIGGWTPQVNARSSISNGWFCEIDYPTGIETQGERYAVPVATLGM
jgi:hypothetical protein